MIGVKSTTKVPTHAAKFAAFLSTAEIQTDRFVARGTAPTNVKALENPALKDNKNASIKFIKDHSFENMGLKGASIYYEVWVEEKFS